MTRNQLVYQQNLETARSNRERERETNRSNVANETETHRSNTARETETNRHNVVTEVETERHNRRGEDIDQQNAISNSVNAAANTMKGISSLIPF